MAGRYERNAFADEGGNDVDVEFVDLAVIEERGDQLSAAHHPDMFSRRRAPALRQCLPRLRYKFRALRRLFRRLPRKDIVGNLRVEDFAFAARLLVIVESPVVGLASPQDRVNGAIERTHTVIDCARAAV